MTNNQEEPKSVVASGDPRTAAVLFVVGLVGLWATAAGFDQTPGSIGLFESLSYASGSLDGVEWWGIPWFEVVCAAVLGVAAVASMVRLGRGRRSSLRSVVTSAGRVFCWFGIWVFSMSVIATVRSGQGFPSLTGWSSGTSVLACIIALVAVDMCWYFEHRSRHALGVSEHEAIATAGDEVRSVVVAVAGSVVSAIVLSLVGFELLVVAVGRLVIEVYTIAVRSNAVPVSAGVLLITSREARSHRMSASCEVAGFGGVFSVWDRLFGAVSGPGVVGGPTVSTGRQVEEVRS